MELDKASFAVLVAIPVIFQPELRRNLGEHVEKVMVSAPPGVHVVTPVVEPAEVLVSGPESILENVQSAHVEVDTGGAQENFVHILPVVGSGNSLDDKYQIMVSPSMAKVFIPVVMGGFEKRVPVEVVLTGAPAAGYEMKRVVVQPQEIRIFGYRDMLNSINHLSTYPVNISGKDRSFTTSAGIKIPASVDTETVAVNVFVDVKQK
ncbi:MAG: YbbR family protein [Clostridia bacterium 41_269]|nr:MAG: YbbR family protein [Clostridia bacterium 41_269]